MSIFLYIFSFLKKKSIPLISTVLKEFSASSEEFSLKLPLPQAFMLCVCLMHFALKKKKRGEIFSGVVDLSLGLGHMKTGIL